jgi:hypothetical protein
VRHELIPYLEHHFNPRLRPALARAAGLLAAEQSLLDALVPAPALDATGSVTLALGELRAAPEALGAPARAKGARGTGGLRESASTTCAHRRAGSSRRRFGPLG